MSVGMVLHGGLPPLVFGSPLVNLPPSLLSLARPLKPAHAQNWTGCKRRKVNSESFHIGPPMEPAHFSRFPGWALCELTKQAQRRHVFGLIGCTGPAAWTCSGGRLHVAGRRMIGGGKRCRHGGPAGITQNVNSLSTKLSTL